MNKPEPRYEHHFVIVATQDAGEDVRFEVDDETCGSRFPTGCVWDKEEGRWVSPSEAGIDSIDDRLGNTLRLLIDGWNSR